jgi:hypothetical protein
MEGQDWLLIPKSDDAEQGIPGALIYFLYDLQSYRFSLNSAGGAVYATLRNNKWDCLWHFTRTDVLVDKNPNTDTWRAPEAFFSTDSCPPPPCIDFANVPAISDGAWCSGVSENRVVDPR